jgi:multidrug efflux pump subunit AcrB
MLFVFNYFWKVVVSLVGAWLLYGWAGYEFTIVTLVACILALNLRK